MRPGLGTVLVALLAAAPVAGARQSLAVPKYRVRATIDVGFSDSGSRGHLDGDRDRMLRSTPDGIRMLDLATGTVGPVVSPIQVTGQIEFGGDVNRIFAVVDEDVVFLDATTFDPVHRVEGRPSQLLLYERERRELYVFLPGRVEVFDALTAAPQGTVDLPERGVPVWTPGRIVMHAGRRESLLAIDTSTKSVEELRLPKGLGRIQIFADATGRTLFATSETQLIALDAATAQPVAALDAGERPYAAFDRAANVVLAAVLPAGAPVRKLMVFRFDARGFTKLSEQDMPEIGQGPPRPTRSGFVTTGLLGSLNTFRSRLLIWERVID